MVLKSSSLLRRYRFFFQTSRSSCRVIPISLPEVIPRRRRSWPLTGKRGMDQRLSSARSFLSPWYFRSSRTLLWASGSRDYKCNESTIKSHPTVWLLLTQINKAPYLRWSSFTVEHFTFSEKKCMLRGECPSNLSKQWDNASFFHFYCVLISCSF